MTRFILKCIVFKVRHPGTREKWYVPYINNKPLRLSWPTRTKAQIYGDFVLDRYLKKRAIAKPRKNGHVD